MKNNNVNIYSAGSMVIVIVSVHLVHSMNAGCWRPSNQANRLATIVHIHYHHLLLLFSPNADADVGVFVVRQRWRELRGNADDEGDAVPWRSSSLEAAGDLQEFVYHRRRVLPVRQATVHAQVRLMDLRRIPGLNAADESGFYAGRVM